MDIHQEAWQDFEARVLHQLRSGELLPPHKTHVVQFLVLPSFDDVISLDIVGSEEVLTAIRTTWKVNEDRVRFRDPPTFLKRRHEDKTALHSHTVDCAEPMLKGLIDLLGTIAEPKCLRNSKIVQLDGVSYELRVDNGRQKWCVSWRAADSDMLNGPLGEAVAELRKLASSPA